MDSPSTKEYIVEGVKISINVLSDIADSLPAPASAIVNVVQRILDIIDVSAFSLAAYP